MTQNAKPILLTIQQAKHLASAIASLNGSLQYRAAKSGIKRQSASWRKWHAISKKLAASLGMEAYMFVDETVSDLIESEENQRQTNPKPKKVLTPEQILIAEYKAEYKRTNGRTALVWKNNKGLFTIKQRGRLTNGLTYDLAVIKQCLENLKMRPNFQHPPNKWAKK